MTLAVAVMAGARPKAVPMMLGCLMQPKCNSVVFCSISLVGFITISCFSPVERSNSLDGTSPDWLSSPGRAPSLSGVGTPLAAPLTAGRLKSPDMRTGGFWDVFPAVSVNASPTSNSMRFWGECRERGHSSPAGVSSSTSGTLPGSIATRAFPFQASQHGSSRRERTVGDVGAESRPSTLSIGADQ